MNRLLALIVGSWVLLIAPALAQNLGPSAGPGGETDTNMHILMQKVKADKKLVVAGNMDLSEAESKKFWPLYDAYQKDLESINQRMGQAINAYAQAFNAGKGTISNEQAKKLLSDALLVEEAEVKLKRLYANKIGKVLSATNTVRHMRA